MVIKIKMRVQEKNIFLKWAVGTIRLWNYVFTNRNKSFNNVFKNIIETSVNPTSLRNFKRIDLGVQIKRSIIENGRSRPKAKGPFAQNSDGTSFSDKY